MLHQVSKQCHSKCCTPNVLQQGNTQDYRAKNVEMQPTRQHQQQNKTHNVLLVGSFGKHKPHQIKATICLDAKGAALHSGVWQHTLITD